MWFINNSITSWSLFSFLCISSIFIRIKIKTIFNILYIMKFFIIQDNKSGFYLNSYKNVLDMYILYVNRVIHIQRSWVTLLCIYMTLFEERENLLECLTYSLTYSSIHTRNIFNIHNIHRYKHIIKSFIINYIYIIFCFFPTYYDLNFLNIIYNYLILYLLYICVYMCNKELLRFFQSFYKKY